MGYRYYVDNLMCSETLGDGEKARMQELIASIDSDPDRAAEEAAHVLSDLMGFAAITTTPKGVDVKMTHFEVIRTGRFNVAVLAVSSVGGVKTRVCRVMSELSDDRLKKVECLLNKSLVFVSSEDINDAFLSSVAKKLGADAAAAEPIVKAAGKIIKSASDVRVYTDGQQHLLKYHELDAHIGELLEMFSDSRSLEDTLKTPEPLKVFVGDGPGALGRGTLSMVIGRYRASGGRYGAVAVAGPVRMNYRYVIPRLSWFRDCLSAMLTSPL